jgi:hypothetical protein
VHYVDAPTDHPKEWELKSETLGYILVEGNHSGANIAVHMMRVLDKYGLCEKVCTYCLLVNWS